MNLLPPTRALPASQVQESPANPEALGSAMKEAIPKAFAGAEERGLPIAGPVVSAYYTWKDGKTEFTSGPVVGADSPQAEGNGLGIRTLAGCKCVTIVHTGPYSELGKTYDATFEWIAAKGLDKRMPCVEIYENSPKDTEESKLRTKICIPIVPKGSS